MVVKIICRSLLQETFVIYDCSFYDYGVTGNKNSNYTKGGALTVTTSDTGTIISSTSSNSGNGRYLQNTGLTGDFEADFDIKTTYDNSVAIYFGVYNGSVYSIARLPNSKWNEARFKRVNGVYTAEIKPENGEWTTLSLANDNAGSGEVYWVFYIYNQTGNTHALAYKNLKVYPI